MGGVPSIRVKFGNELALVCDLPLPITNLLLGFRETLPNSRPIHGFCHEPRYRASVFSHAPIYLARCSRSVGHSLGKQ